MDALDLIEEMGHSERRIVDEVGIRDRRLPLRMVADCSSHATVDGFPEPMRHLAVARRFARRARAAGECGGDRVVMNRAVGLAADLGGGATAETLLVAAGEGLADLVAQ